MSKFTIISTLVIVVAFIWAWGWIARQKTEGRLYDKRRWIESLPSLVSTLGVLGTFVGITMGLIDFDTTDITGSIPSLLDGMKTAFFTSLAGMVCSLILSNRVSNAYDEKDGGATDAENAAGMIVEAVRTLSQTVDTMNANQTNFYVNALQHIKHVSTDTTMKAVLLQMQTHGNTLEKVQQKVGDMAQSLGNVEKFSNQQQAKFADLDKKLESMVDMTEGMSNVQEEISAEVKTFGEKLHGEVVEIEDKMDGTNRLLTQKFDEFTELLKKSNTEALVEVMKRVTEEFQKQMNDLISRLVKENFEQLNKSVEQLNTWQMENKEMVTRLTMQYKQMADNFEGTSTTLEQVKTDTQTLVSKSGKLQQIVRALDEVMVKDEKFMEITRNLSDTTALTKDNMQMFDEATNKLNEWVKKQRDFREEVAVLLQKLEEINQIRDLGNQFWNSTRKGLEEGMKVVLGSSKALQDNLKNLDKQFYERLAATLAELDACIQAMVNGR